MGILVLSEDPLFIDKPVIGLAKDTKRKKGARSACTEGKLVELDDDLGEYEELNEAESEGEEDVLPADPERDLLQYYMNEVGKYELLTPEEELSLAMKKEAGCVESGKQLVRCNLRLVIGYAKWYMYRGLPLEDLVQEGNVGLMRAVKKFDTSYGYRLSTYAGWWIKQMIKSALKNKARSIRLPVHIEELLPWRAKAFVSLLAKLGRPPETDELMEGVVQSVFLNSQVWIKARQTKMGTEKALKIIRSRVRYMEEALTQTRVASLNQEVGSPAGDSDTELLDFIDSGVSTPEDIFGTSEISKKVMEPALAILTERQRQIVRRRFGFDGPEETLEEIGDSLGITRERIRQIEKIAFRRLRLYFQREKRARAEALVSLRGAR